MYDDEWMGLLHQHLELRSSSLTLGSMNEFYFPHLIATFLPFTI